jgi:hypothetical protein
MAVFSEVIREEEQSRQLNAITEDTYCSLTGRSANALGMEVVTQGGRFMMAENRKHKPYS